MNTLNRAREHFEEEINRLCLVEVTNGPTVEGMMHGAAASIAAINLSLAAEPDPVLRSQMLVALEISRKRSLPTVRAYCATDAVFAFRERLAAKFAGLYRAYGPVAE